MPSGVLDKERVAYIDYRTMIARQEPNPVAHSTGMVDYSPILFRIMDRYPFVPNFLKNLQGHGGEVHSDPQPVRQIPYFGTIVTRIIELFGQEVV